MVGVQEYIVAQPKHLKLEIQGDDLSWVGGILTKNGDIVRGITVVRKDMLGEYTDTL